MVEDVIKLIETVPTKDKYGVLHLEEKKRQVFAKVESVTQTEFFKGGQNGLRPQYKMTMFGPDYNSEELLEYNGEQYAIYRTFSPRPDEIELYVEFRKGTEQNAFQERY